MGDVLSLPNGVTLEMVDVSPRRVRSVRVRPAPPPVVEGSPA
jgi:hypothetical protein